MKCSIVLLTTQQEKIFSQESLEMIMKHIDDYNQTFNLNSRKKPQCREYINRI